MKPYPVELRQCIVEAVDQQYGTVEEIAQCFRVSERYVYKLLRLRQQTGGLAVQPHGGGAQAKLDEQNLLQLAELVAKFPDATLEQLRELLRRRRVHVCTNTVWRALQQLNLTLKKSAVAPGKPTSRSVPPFARSN